MYKNKHKSQFHGSFRSLLNIFVLLLQGAKSGKSPEQLIWKLYEQFYLKSFSWKVVREAYEFLNKFIHRRELIFQGKHMYLIIEFKMERNITQ